MVTSSLNLSFKVSLIISSFFPKIYQGYYTTKVLFLPSEKEQEKSRSGFTPNRHLFLLLFIFTLNLILSSVFSRMFPGGSPQMVPLRDYWLILLYDFLNFFYRFLCSKGNLFNCKVIFIHI